MKNINNHNKLVNICKEYGIDNYDIPENLFVGKPNDASNRVGIYRFCNRRYFK